MTDTLRLPLRSQSPARDVDSRVSWEATESAETWRTEHTALVICDVWDRHPFRGAELRLEAMLPRMQRVVQALRDRGSLVVHAPSETMAFYEGVLARRRSLATQSIQLPPPTGHPDPPPPPYA